MGKFLFFSSYTKNALTPQGGFIVVLKIIYVILLPFIQIPGLILRYLPFHKDVPPNIRKKIFFLYGIYFLTEYGILYALHYLGLNLFTLHFFKWYVGVFGWGLLIINILYIPHSFFKHIAITGFQSQFSIFIHSTIAIFIGTKLNTLPLILCLIIQIAGFLILSFTIIIILSMRIKKSPLLNKINRFDYNWKQIGILSPLYLYISIITTTTLDDHWISNYQQFFIRITNIIVPITIISLINSDFAKKEKSIRIENANELLLMQKESVLQQANIVAQNEKNLHIIRHDIRHHLQIMRALIQNKEYDKMLEFIQTIDNRILTNKPILFCENIIINSVLFLYSEKCKKSDISTSFCVDFYEDMPFDSYDISILLSNALENAFFACLKLPVEKRRIVLNNRIFENKMALSIQNTFDGKITFGPDGIPISNQSEHGIGMQSISYIIKKYQGTLHCRAEEGLFDLSILMFMPISDPPPRKILLFLGFRCFYSSNNTLFLIQNSILNRWDLVLLTKKHHSIEVGFYFRFNRYIVVEPISSKSSSNIVIGRKDIPAFTFCQNSTIPTELSRCMSCFFRHAPVLNTNYYRKKVVR